MNIMRFSAAPAGRLTDRTAAWAIFGDRPGYPDGLEAGALANISLSQIAPVPGAPMFEPHSLFGAHVAGLPCDVADDSPIVVFVHGFEHEPRRPVLPRIRSDNPHRSLYHFDETEDGPGSREERIRGMTPWFARALLPDGTGSSADCAGMAVGFAYPSYGGRSDLFVRRGPSWPSIVGADTAEVFADAYADAEMAGYGLAAVLTQLRARLDHQGLPHRRIDILAHGLGARVAISALALVAQRFPEDRTLGRIDRVILLSGACYWGQAAYCLANIIFADASVRPSFYNVTAPRDATLTYLERRRTPQAAIKSATEDLSLDADTADPTMLGRTIGRSGHPPESLYGFFGSAYSDWIDLPLDGQSGRVLGRYLGVGLSGPTGRGRGDHWASYTDPKNWALYRAILHRKVGFDLPDLEDLFRSDGLRAAS